MILKVITFEIKIVQIKHSIFFVDSVSKNSRLHWNDNIVWQHSRYIFIDTNRSVLATFSYRRHRPKCKTLNSVLRYLNWTPFLSSREALPTTIISNSNTVAYNFIDREMEDYKNLVPDEFLHRIIGKKKNCNVPLNLLNLIFIKKCNTSSISLKHRGFRHIHQTKMVLAFKLRLWHFF